MVLARTEFSPIESKLATQFGQPLSDEITKPDQIQNFLSQAIKPGSNLFGLVGAKKGPYGCSALLLRKLKSFQDSIELVQVTNASTGDWLEKLKKLVADNVAKGKSAGEETKQIWLYSREKFSGLVGMVNCLRLEPGGAHVRAILDLDGSLPVSKAIDFGQSPWKEIATTDLVFNVYQKGQWGAFRFLQLPEEHEEIETSYAHMNVETRGDLSSFKWYESENVHFESVAPADKLPGLVLCDVYCSPLNFKDVMLAIGRIHPGPESALFDCVIGLEFSGRRRDTGQRVMGMIPYKGFATTVLTFEDFLLTVPDDWTLEEAASIPVVYFTAYYALVVRGQVSEGDKVLIHSAAGGVGQAAIRICQDLNCEIYVTVGNEQKRQFIRDTFNIPDERIMNSRDIAFERQIKQQTKGQGVRIVLNSLADDKLQVSSSFPED